MIYGSTRNSQSPRYGVRLIFPMKLISLALAALQVSGLYFIYATLF